MIIFFERFFLNSVENLDRGNCKTPRHRKIALLSHFAVAGSFAIASIAINRAASCARSPPDLCLGGGAPLRVARRGPSFSLRQQDNFSFQLAALLKSLRKGMRSFCDPAIMRMNLSLRILPNQSR